MNKVAIGRVVLTNREHIIALEPLDKGLMGTLLRYPYEVRSEEEYFDDIQDVKVTKDISISPGNRQSEGGRFEPDKFEDQYETALVELINQSGPASLSPRKSPSRRERGRPDGCAAQEHRRRTPAKDSRSRPRNRARPPAARRKSDADRRQEAGQEAAAKKPAAKPSGSQPGAVALASQIAATLVRSRSAGGDVRKPRPWREN